MKTRDKILDLLESRKGEYISGEELASELSVTRAAVWKAVTGLREDGYPINAVPNKGYRLAEETDYLTEQGIWNVRSGKILNCPVPEGRILLNSRYYTDQQGNVFCAYHLPSSMLQKQSFSYI